MMAAVTLSARLLPPDPAGGAVLLVVLYGQNQSDTSAELSVALDLLDASGHLLAALELEPQLAAPGPVLLDWSRTLNLVGGVAEARWRCDAVQTRCSAPLRRALGPGREPGRVQPVLYAPPRSVSAAPVPVAAPPRPTPPADPPRLPPVAAPPSADRIQRAITEPLEAVASLFPADSLDSAGRDRVRELLHSPLVEERIAGCRIATACGWRTTVHAMRRMLEDADPWLRAAAATGIGALAGPAMEHLLRQLVERDSDPAVVEAARAGMAAIADRSPL